MDLIDAKAEVAAFMRRTYQRYLTTSTGGNISRRLGAIMLITPSGKDKSSLTEDDIAEVVIETGENLTPRLKLSIESDMHRLIYKERDDVDAVVHAHPVFSCLYSASGESINTTLIAESWYLLDRVERIPYQRMGTKALADVVCNYFSSTKANVALLEKHGAIALGKSLLGAFDRLECLEQAAKMSVFSHLVKAEGLDDIQLDEISEMRG